MDIAPTSKSKAGDSYLRWTGSHTPTPPPCSATTTSVLRVRLATSCDLPSTSARLAGGAMPGCLALNKRETRRWVLSNARAANFLFYIRNVCISISSRQMSGCLSTDEHPTRSIPLSQACKVYSWPAPRVPSWNERVPWIRGKLLW